MIGKPAETNTASRKRVGVLISGRGSNMVSLAEAAQTPGYPAEIALVICGMSAAGSSCLVRGALRPSRAVCLPALTWNP